MKSRYGLCLMIGIYLICTVWAGEADLLALTRECLSDEVFYSDKRILDTHDDIEYDRLLRFCKDKKILAQVQNLTYERVASFDPMRVVHIGEVSSQRDWLFDRGQFLNRSFMLCQSGHKLSDAKIFAIAAKAGEIRLLPKKKWTEEELTRTTVAERRADANRRMNVNSGLASYRGRLLDILREVTRDRMCELSDEEFIAYTNKIAIAARISSDELRSYFDDNISYRLGHLWIKLRAKQPQPVYDFVHDRTITHETPDYDLYESEVLRERFCAENYTRQITDGVQQKLSKNYQKLKEIALKDAKALSLRKISQDKGNRLLVRWVRLLEEESRLRKIPAGKLNPDYNEIRRMVLVR